MTIRISICASPGKLKTIIVLSSHKGFPDIFIFKKFSRSAFYTEFSKNRTAKKSGIVLKRSIFVFPGGFFPRFLHAEKRPGIVFF